MEPRISMVTLGVKDVEKALSFYRDGLGWKAESPDPSVAFFQLNNVIFSLFRREALARDAGVSDTGEGSFRGAAFSYNVGTEQAVDETLRAAEQAGAKIIKPGQKVFWGGYSGYFADLDGHLWEVAHNPFWKIDAEGNVRLH